MMDQPTYPGWRCPPIAVVIAIAVGVVEELEGLLAARGAGFGELRHPGIDLSEGLVLQQAHGDVAAPDHGCAGVCVCACA
jgi:hypothetical protein